MIKSYAKINLFLKVLKKNNKGLHNIQSCAMLLSLYDGISLKKINKNKDNIKFTGQFKKNINTKVNTISKSLFLLRKHNLINSKNRYKITINKNIPIFAGLGGGTSNAVFLIKYFLKNKISDKLLSIFEKKIGSDFRLFFLNHSFQKSLKEILKFKKRYTFYFLLVYPNISSSTKEVYAKVKKFNLPLKNNLSKIDSKERYIEFIKREKNDLQKIVESKHEKIKKILDLIKIQKNCLFSRMTGSGSVCFGLFFNKKSAKQGLIKIQKKLPNFWCMLTKSI
jgi:4-diphosphocytidyl-2-C-methyl-D-erythritol kinase